MTEGHERHQSQLKQEEIGTEIESLDHKIRIQQADDRRKANTDAFIEKQKHLQKGDFHHQPFEKTD